MSSPYSLPLVEHCNDCPLRHVRGGFCNMAAEPVQALDAIKFTATYPRGAVLFMEGDQPRGVFIVCGGRAKLTTSSAGGRTLIVNLAGPGQVLGVSAAMLGTPYEVTAETLEPSQVSFIRRDEFLRLLVTYTEACLHTAAQLSETYAAAQREIRTLGLAQSTSEKLARLLLDWSRHGTETPDGTRMQLLVTHEEIAQMIGSTRETVTRILSEFKRRKLIRVKGSSLFLVGRDAIREMVTV